MAKFSLLSYEFRQTLKDSEPALFEFFTPQEIDNNFTHKQELFEKFFEKENFPEKFDFNGKKYNVSLLWKYNGIIVFQLERRGWHNQSLNFKSNKIPDNPWIDILVDNRHERQLIAVRKNTSAFKYTHTIAQILEANISKWLNAHYGLVVSIHAQYESKLFWTILHENHEKYGIEKLQFNFAFPNKDWITERIKDLQKFGKQRNGATRLGFEANKGEALYFVDNEDNRALVNACSGTGEDIIIKPRKHKAIHMLNEMNPVEQEMTTATHKLIFETDLSTELFGDEKRNPYIKAGEFLNRCKQYY